MADDIEKKDFEKLIKKNAQSMRSVMLASGTDCMRIYDRNLSAFPVTVDLYGKFARITDYSDGFLCSDDLELCRDVVHRLAYIESEKIVVVERKKRENREQHQKKDVKAVFADVSENGLKFTCNLTTYTDTGLFLDSVNARRMIMESCSGCDVLNLFSYTGAFSVYAAAGGAKTVTSVDMSSTYTSWAKENLEKNGFSGDSYRCVCKEAMKFLREISHNGPQYDIIIFDPPGFSNSHRMEHDFDVQRDWVKWIKLIAGVLRKNGFIFFSVNLGDFRMDRRSLRGLKIRETTALFRADGFSGKHSGTVRSWIMTFDDKALSLDWSNEKKVSNAGENKRHFQNGDVRKNDRYGKHSRNPLREREHRNYGSHRNYENGREDRYGFSDTSRSDSYFPARERGNGDRNRSFCSGNGHRAAYSGYGRRDEYGYGRDSGSHNTGSGQSGFRKYPDRNRRSDGEDFSRSSYRAGAQGRGRTSDRRREKPYGYDVFKPSRNRDDNPDFFWTEERSGIKRDK